MTPSPINVAQQDAITHPIDRPLKVSAGPGTGKTHVLARRYLHLLEAEGLRPHQILALTFTNRAAAEMRERVARDGLTLRILPSALDLADSWIGTFHGACLRLLQENPLAAGLPVGIATCDDVEKRRLRDSLRHRVLDGDLGGETWRPDDTLLLDLAEDSFWQGLWTTIDRLQDLLITPDEFAAMAATHGARRRIELETELAGGNPGKNRQEMWRQDSGDYAHLADVATVVTLLYRAYQAHLRRLGMLDFPGQIMAAYRLLVENPDVQARYQSQFRHILVDEVQDTSGAQMKLVAALAAPNMANVTLIGDVKQSIYGWRNARPENLARFAPSDHGGTACTLQHSYRSYQEILDVAAHALLPLARRRRIDEAELDLIAAKGASGRCQVTIAGPARDMPIVDARRHEAAYVAARIAALRAGGYRGEDIVILMRSVALAAPYADALRDRDIPTLIVGGKGFYGRPEVRDVLALLRVAANLLDSAAMARVMQGPLCGLSDAAVAAVSRHGGSSLYEGLVRAETLPFSVPGRGDVVRRAALLVTLLERAGRRVERVPLPELLHGALAESGYLDYARTRPDVERERILANLEKLRRAACAYAVTHPRDTAAAFASHLSYVFDEGLDEAEESVDAGPDVVRFLTIHQAKGLEFPVVVVVNAMPRSYRLDDPPAMTWDEDEGFLLLKRRDPQSLEMRDAADMAAYKERGKERSLEEERYVWYVALTRARERLILTTPRPPSKPLNKSQEWPLRELYAAVTGDTPDGKLSRAVVVETFDDPPHDVESTHGDAPAPLEDALERVRAAAALAAREEPPVAAPPPGPITLSYSALRTYRACPRRYQLQHALRLPAVPAALRPRSGAPRPYDPVVLGAAVHAALERCPEPGRADRQALVAAFAGSCRASGLDEAEIEQVYLPRGEAMLDLYLRRVVGAGQVQRVYAEMAVRQLMRDGPIPVYLVGRVDRIDLDSGGWRMVDYKTHSALAPTDVEEAAVQLRLYKAAWQRGAAAALGEQPGDPRLYVYEATGGALHEVDGGPRALDAAVNLLCDVAGKIAAGDFAPPPDYDPPCAACDFGGPYGLCPDRRDREEARDPDVALAGEVYGARRYDHGAAPGQYPMLGPNGLGEDQGPIPDAAGESPATPSGAPCFLCAADEQGRCARAYLSGRVRDVQAHHGEHGTRARALLEDDGRELWLELAPPWQSLGSTLQDLLAAGLSVRLAAYHLARGHGSGQRPTYRAAERALVALEPDTLIDATAIAQAGYCARRSLIEDLTRRGVGSAMAQGSAIHVAFARGLLRGEPPMDHLDAALRGAAPALAFASDGDDEISTYERAEDHLRRAGEWLEAHRPAGRVRTEALLLSPGLGLRGRADAIVDPDGHPMVIDLKTGTSAGPDPRAEHAVQMAVYDLLLRERGRPPEALWLLYSGNPAGDVGRRVPVGHDGRVEVMRLRNELAAIALLGRAPLSPYPRRCMGCRVIAECRDLSFLNGESSYALDKGRDEALGRLSEDDARFFRHYSALLRLEGRAAEASVRGLWRLTATERVARGSALDVTGAPREARALDDGEEMWRFSVENHCDLREGDIVLVSDGDPIMGESEQGVVESATADELVVRLRGALVHEPRLVDRYAVDSGWLRGLRMLWAWVRRPVHLRRLVDGSAPPRFDPVEEIAVPGANDRQRNAVALALAARDYLLVQGPPGAGKTATIAHMVRVMRRRGQRVLLASFTNRAVDTMLRALAEEDRHEAVRLGGEAATEDDLRPTLLARRAAAAGLSAPAAIKALLDGAGVVAATAATLAGASHDEQRFDVTIVDEASQLTVPAVLAALRLARCFVLVGDDRQLPPVVQSAEAAAIEDGLAVTLFTLLRRRLDESGETHALVMLEEQYRMNAEICAFPSRTWYDGRLRAGTPDVEQGRLSLDLGAVPAHVRHILDPARPAVFVDVQPDGGAVGNGTPRTSPAEARQVRDLCAALIAGGAPSGTIGVIAPYRAQVALIRYTLREAGLGAIVADTVDRFQGSERAIMVLSLVGGSGEPGSLLRDERRLNVALTRARFKLIVLGYALELRADPLYAGLLDAMAAAAPTN